MSTENFSWLLLDPNSNTIVSASPLPTILIRRVSDGFIYDFNDNNFKSVGWVTKNKNLLEVDSSGLPGVYETSVDITLFDGIFYVYANYAAAQKQSIVSQFKVIDGVVRVDPNDGLTTVEQAHLTAIPENPLLTSDARLNNLDSTISSAKITAADKNEIVTGSKNAILGAETYP